jgi:NAD(P)-dependent dehydrogenase (short-subunit alcohol dehydrogenase family)
MAPKTWLVTGCSSGFGEDLIYALLKHGDVAIATGRGDVSRLISLKDAGAHVYSLDITAPAADIKKTVGKILEDVGSIDVLVNNAAYVHGGMIEELRFEFSSMGRLAFR